MAKINFVEVDGLQLRGEIYERNLFYKTIQNAQNVLAKWIVPDSGISDKDCLTELLGILDNQELVKIMREE